MEAVCSSETSMIVYLTIRRHIPKDSKNSHYIKYFLGNIYILFTNNYETGQTLMNSWVRTQTHRETRKGEKIKIITSNGEMTNERWFGRNFRDKRPWRNRGIIPEFAWRNREKPRKSSIRIAGIATWNRTEHFLNVSLQCPRYVNPLGGEGQHAL
jgi:hypothetical protein